MKRLARLLPFLAALLLAAASAAGTSPRLDAFSGAAALSNAAAFYRLGPKPAASPQSAAAAEHICAALQAAGVPDATLDDFPHPTRDGEKTFRNVLASIPPAGGATNAPILLFAAHYDTKIGISDDFAGANDSASGVGALLELARVIASDPLRHEVRLAFFDGEEAAIEYAPNDGFHGSQHLAAQLLENGDSKRLDAMILLDMVGDASFSLTLPSNVDRDLLQKALSAAEAEGIRPSVTLLPYPIGDDHLAFQAIHVPAIDLIDFAYGSAPRLNDYWHTPADTLDKLSPDSLAFASRIALRIAEDLDAQLPPAAPPPTGRFTTALWTIGLGAVALLLLLLGLVGCIIPALPGPPLAYAALLVLQCHPSHPFSLGFLVTTGLLVVAVSVADTLAAPWLARKTGGSKLGAWGSLAGLLVGLFLFPPFGFLLGCLFGAFAGELLSGAKTGKAFGAALAAFVGFLLGTGLKLLLCGYLLFVAARALFP